MEVRKATEKLPYAVIMALLPMQLRLAWGFILKLTQSSAKILKKPMWEFSKDKNSIIDYLPSCNFITYNRIFH